jgi:hypothetical protein
MPEAIYVVVVVVGFTQGTDHPLRFGLDWYTLEIENAAYWYLSRAPVPRVSSWV